MYTKFINAVLVAAVLVVALFSVMSAKEETYTVTVGRFESKEIEKKMYIADTFQVDNYTESYLIVCGGTVEYYSKTGKLIHSHDLDELGVVEPLGVWEAPGYRFYQVSDRQLSVISTPVVSLTIVTSETVDPDNKGAACK